MKKMISIMLIAVMGLSLAACCGNDEHTHTTSCYRNVGTQSTPANAPSGVENGYIFAVRSNYRYTYYIYIPFAIRQADCFLLALSQIC